MVNQRRARIDGVIEFGSFHPPMSRAVRQATSSIPIVMAAVNDPVEQGFVSSLAHPGGNITGFSFIDFQMVGKWLTPWVGHRRLARSRVRC
jgi:ABC transporter substrate binding protein